MIDRILRIVRESGLSERAFAAKCKLTQNALWYQLNGKRKVSLETVMAIATAYPEVDCNWLIRGTGEMVHDNEAEDKRLDNLIDVIAMQQETIKNLQEKIKQLKTTQS